MNKLEEENSYKITNDDFNSFMNAKTNEERLNILVAHSQKNKKRIKIRRIRKMNENQKVVEQEMLELNNQFGEFLRTKGIKAKFKLAFSNMAESTRKQHEKDVKSFNEVKAKSIEDNKDFVEFLHAKGIKAKFKVVVNNIKKGIKEAPQKTARQIANSKPNIANNNDNISAEILSKEFNEFLKAKNLDSEYVVEIIEE